MNFKFFVLIFFTGILLQAQNFVKVTDVSNPIVSTQTGQNYSGAAWIDYNNDGLLDLYTTPSFLFKNLGDGNFETIKTIIGSSQNGGGSNATSWADVDNDGDLDCILVGKISTLYINRGNDTFGEYNYGDIGLLPDLANYPDLRGWSGAFADYNNDSWVDIIITHAAGFHGVPATPSHFFKNTSNTRFEKLSDFEFTNNLAPYTVATWADYDLDGDMDLFIGSGPAGTPGPDHNYTNTLKETGTANFERITTQPISELQDGQVWNWIDYDNDGDLDGFLTNYGGAPNRFYRNDDGVYTKLSNPLTGVGSMLANAWADVDNDGDLDVVLTGDTGNGFYINNGDGTFIEVNNDISSLTSIGATWGDYDNDGDLDLFLSGNGEGKALFKNGTSAENGWIILSLKGTASNNAAIGAKVRAKATINGSPVWQMREVSAQNSFNSHNSLRVHFGLGDATTVDSLQVIWPSGQESVLENIPSKQIMTISEEIPNNFFRANFSADKRLPFGKKATVQFKDLTLTGENNPVTSWQWDFNNDGITDATDQNPSWLYDSTGVFSVRLTVSDGTQSEEKTFQDYIILRRDPGFPVINFASHTFSDTLLEKGQRINFVLSVSDTSGYPLSYSWKLNNAVKSKDSTYNYRASAFGVPRTDTVIAEISNGFNSSQKVWVINVVADITAIAGETNGLPKTFSLAQNFPNPFNPKTTIDYQLKSNSQVELNVYNALGQIIKSLKNEKQSAGKKSIVWNGTDALNNPVGSGIYYYTLKVKDGAKVLFAKSHKMLLLK